MQLVRKMEKKKKRQNETTTKENHKNVFMYFKERAWIPYYRQRGILYLCKNHAITVHSLRPRIKIFQLPLFICFVML